MENQFDTNLTTAWHRADAAWSAELVATYGEGAARYIRYSSDGRGTATPKLAELYAAREDSRGMYQTAIAAHRAAHEGGAA